jgi:hypothetical protein
MARTASPDAPLIEPERVRLRCAQAVDTGGTGTVGSAFQRLDAFRSGFKTAFDAFRATGAGLADGFAACLAGSGAAAARSHSEAGALSS